MFFHRNLQIFRQCIELRIGDLHFCMGTFHTATGILAWTATQLAELFSQQGSQSFLICFRKAFADSRVCRDNRHKIPHEARDARFLSELLV